MTAKHIPSPATVSHVSDKKAKGKTPRPPTPKEVNETVESQHAARPGQGPKNKGSIDQP